MTVTRAVRRALLASHVALATAGIGLEVAVLVDIAARPLTSDVQDAPEVTRLFTVLAIVVAIALVSGILGALVSPWRLLGTPWVMKKLGLNLLTVVTVTTLSIVSAQHGDMGLWVLGLVTFAALAKSLLSVVLSVYKPGSRRATGAGEEVGAVNEAQSPVPI